MSGSKYGEYGITSRSHAGRVLRAHDIMYARDWRVVPTRRGRKLTCTEFLELSDINDYILRKSSSLINNH